eukprot:106352_1
MSTITRTVQVMNNVCVFSLFCMFTILVLPVLANIECITRASGKSGTTNDAQASVKCNSTETLMSCGIKSHNETDQYVDGSFITDDTCYAVNGHHGAGMYAMARCCTFPHTTVNCQEQKGPYVGNVADKGTLSVLYCPSSYTYLLGCSALSPYHSTDGSYPGLTPPNDATISYDTDYAITSSACTSRTADGPSNDNTQAMGQCCEFPDYAITCIKRFGVPGTPLSTIVCPAGYFMSGCSGWSYTWSINSWYIEGDVCYARSRDGNNVWATSICCTIDSENPSMYPTNNPSIYPSVIPSFGVLDYDEKEVELDVLRAMYQSTAGGFVLLCLFVAMTGYIDSRWIRTNDYFEYLSIGTMMLATLDMVSDCFFAVEVSIREMRIIFYGSVLFIGLPSLVALFQLHFHTTKYWLDGGRVTPWIQKYIAVLLLVSIVTGNAFAAVSLMNSGLYHMDVFYMGLTKYQLQTFNIQKMYSIVFLEDVPQLCLQSYYLWISEDVHNPIAISSIILSMVSIIVSAMHLSIEKQINYQQKYVIVKLHVTGECVVQKRSNCKTLYHDLKRELSTYLGINEDSIEIMKPTNIDGGVKVRIILTKNGKNDRQNDKRVDTLDDDDADETYEARDEDDLERFMPMPKKLTQELSDYVKQINYNRVRELFEHPAAAKVFEANWKLDIDTEATLDVSVEMVMEESKQHKKKMLYHTERTAVLFKSS